MPTATQPAIVHYALRPHAVELREVPVPEVREGEVLLQVGGVSVCGSDIHQSHNTHSWPVNVPVVLGHEFGGTIAHAGPGVRGFREGDRVVSETAAQICGECMMCRTGSYNLCQARLGFGYGLDGAMARWVRVPARCLHHIPDSLPFEIACLAEPHAVAFQAMCVNSAIRPGDAVVVLGPGPIGLLCTRMAALSGAMPLIVTGVAGDAPRLETARALGATHTVDVQTDDLAEVVRDLTRGGADLVCDATGASQPLEDAIRITRPGGQVTKVGWSPEPFQIDMNPVVHRNIRIQGSFSHNYPVWERVIHLLDRGVTLPERIVGMRVPLEGWREAFEAMSERNVIKSVLLPGSD
ncbi:MAG: zinc-binding dehydrogenase [Acidobacteria bacterium]|nr:zinc-binding dehydrogenase [Acidobacteriota bacterium]